MSTELINRITIKKDGVYLSSHSNNDTAPFHSWHCKSLTDVYNNGGQKALNIEIIRMLCEYAQTRGNHPSVLKYEYALRNPKCKEIYKKYRILDNEKYNNLTDEDKKSRWDDVSTNAMEEYLKYSEELDNRKYAEIAELVQDIKKQTVNDPFELLTSLGY